MPPARALTPLRAGLLTLAVIVAAAQPVMADAGDEILPPGTETPAPPAQVAPGATSEATAAGAAAPTAAPAPRVIPSPLWTESRPSRSDRRSDPLRFNTFADLAERLSPAVVSIEVNVEPSPQSIIMGDVAGQGSGFIIHAQGYVVTNEHVVRNARSIRVTTNDGSSYSATTIGADEPTDIALLRIDADREFPVAPLGDSARLRPGDWVVAIGNPFGLRHTVTAGIISALGRRHIAPGGSSIYADFIQIDAAINFGNSGGPLINVNGEVVGVNTALRSGNSIGFAIPINMVKTLLPQIAQGTVERSWLGVTLQDLTHEMARARGLDRARGSLLANVVPGSPAAQAGLRPGDLVVRFGDRDVNDSAQLRWMTSIAGVGTVVDVTILREGRRMTVEVTMGAQERDRASTTADPSRDQTAQGVTVTRLEADEAERLGMAGRTGVIVTTIASSSVAAAAGLRVGDVITHVGDVPVVNPAGFVQSMQAHEPGQLIRLRVRRGASMVFLSFVHVSDL